LPQPITASRVRLQMIQGEQNAYTTRIYEFAVYGYLKGEDPTGIEDPSSPFRGRNEGGIYDLSGRQVNADANSSLQRGLYVKKGKKIIKP